MLTHVFLAFNMRSERESIFKLGLFTNKVIVIWAAASIAALVIGVNLPVVLQALKIHNPLPLMNGLLLLSLPSLALLDGRLEANCGKIAIMKKLNLRYINSLSKEGIVTIDDILKDQEII